MLEVSRDADAAGEEQLVNFAAGQSKYCFIYAVTLDPCGDFPFTSWGRWQRPRDGAGSLSGYSAACGCGTDYRCGPYWGETCGNMLEAMARIAPRKNSIISLDPSSVGF